ncbi:prolyl aminopeptidase [Gammaproteobacteria bacterium]|nr:prolyl aminopeptidase [Gammaproteobacteria bacterium]
MLPLYPEIKPYIRHQLKVDDIHELYMDESGTPDGIPVVFVHGGPGSGCEFNSRCFFNPEKYRIILFDQRGAGRSTPNTELTDNTTDHLVSDMNKIREHLGIDKWIVFGGGWGATLSLAYAQKYPETVLGLILRGVFLGRQQDIDWFSEEGASLFFPDHWEDFVSPLLDKAKTEGSEKPSNCEAYYELMIQDNELARMSGAKAWSTWEAHVSTLHPDLRLIKHFSDGGRAHARCLIATYYFRNQCFLEPDQLLKNASVLENIPGIIVHARFDCVSPLNNAHQLHNAWPTSQLYIVREAGHSAREPAMIDALIRATRDMAIRFEADFHV